MKNNKNILRLILRVLKKNQINIKIILKIKDMSITNIKCYNLCPTIIRVKTFVNRKPPRSMNVIHVLNEKRIKTSF